MREKGAANYVSSLLKKEKVRSACEVVGRSLFLKQSRGVVPSLLIVRIPQFFGRNLLPIDF